jgi:hypothetical protein
MPFGEVRLIPCVNVERTPTLLEAGISASQLIRFKDGLAQKYGGWQKFYPNTVSGVPRDLHAWQDLNQTNHLAVGTTTQLAVITSGALVDVTPQTLTSDFAPNFSTVINTATVTIVDPNISNVTVFDSVLFNVPIAVGGLILSGLYPIVQITGTHSYQITAASNATSTVNNGGAVPVFTTTSGSGTVSVALTAHGQVAGNIVVFPIPTTGNGVTIDDAYTIASVADANDFSITAGNQANASSSFSMNGGNAEIVYYINLGPAAIGQGYGLGGYGQGGYGTGNVPGSQTGTKIAAGDWTSDNWGQILLACPSGGGVYSFDPTGGFGNAGLVASAPPFNGGIFISQSQQILICWGSTVTENIGIQQDPLLVKWSTSGDFTNFVPLTTNQAGSFRIPFGSVIRAGMAVSNQDLIWTDLDLWAMSYVGPQFVFDFNNIGAGCGAISSHAVQKLRGGIFWMGSSNFYRYTASGVTVVPCPVWDFVFQNLNTAFAQNVRAMSNTPFNEAGWLFPSNASASGECDSYVKFNITEPNAPWDYGPAGSLPRSAWMDQTILGMPIGASPTGIVYQHETTNDADGGVLNPSFTTGYFYIAQGEEFAMIDQIIPDFKYGTYGGSQGANIALSVNMINYPGDAPTTFGPFLFTQSAEYQSTRMYGRQASFTVQSSDIGSFWRLGKVRYRYQLGGRR